MQTDEGSPQFKTEMGTNPSPRPSKSPEEGPGPGYDPTGAGADGPRPGNAELDEDMESGPMANAPFVNKVWLIVNNPANHQFIRWVPGGKSILIVDREGFEKQLLPYYFKHKRFTSFVRQLNMYGWHKVQDLSAGTMQSNEEHWQFANPNFIQGQPELLKDIVRNKGHKPAASTGQSHSGPGGGAAPSGDGDPSRKENSQSLQAILNELEQIKSRQQAIGEDLGRMRRDNELLWTEYYQTRERYDKHSQVLGRILRFLATIYGNQSKILDLNDPMNELIMQGGANPTHGYSNLLPAAQQNRAAHFDSGIHDLREIEQLQHQIEEASTPGSSASSNTGFSQSHYASGQRSPAETGGAGATPTGGKAASGGKIASGGALTRPAAASPHPALPVANPRRLSSMPYWADAEPNPNNQLVRAVPNRLPGGPGRAPAAAPAGPFPPTQGHVSPYQSPQLQELPANARSMEDPAQLFPELGDFGGPNSMPPLTSQELEQITREVASNGTSLQNIQEWLAKQNIESDEHFNVDDFLDNDEAAPAGPSPTPGRKNSTVEEPDSKRVRVS